MALHTDLPIHKTGCQLLALAVTAHHKEVLDGVRFARITITKDTK